MSLTTAFILLAVAGLAGTGFGYFLRWIITMGQRGSMELQIKSKFLEAQEEATKIINEGKKKGAEEAERLVKEHKEKEQELKQTSERMVRREELLDKRQADVDKEQEELKTKIEGVKQLRDRVDLMVKEQEEKLSKVAGLGVEEAREEIMKKAEKQYAADLEARMHKLEMSNNDKIDRKAKDIITTAVHRIGNSVPHDVLSTTVTLPNDDIKGKIIGKEGRNIKAFERATGVEVIVDDTPGTITLSSFDPVRRQIARVALENLILDGRIQPARIEEVVEKAKEEITVIMKKKGEEAAYEARVSNVDPRLIMILGRLYFRTSYGQNVLNHSVEMSHLAGIMAEELGANVAVARAGALFHDIGKAVDHEVTGTHVEIGRRILQKFGISEDVVKAMQAHHEEYPYETPESMIVQVADAISGGRPGARRDTVENYIKRLEELEGIAKSKPGVDKVYAIQAGREVRVFVKPEAISDFEARELAKSIAEQIEKEMQYPGEIKVNVIRESRVIEYAR
jgi:ribonuclease Y